MSTSKKNECWSEDGANFIYESLGDLLSSNEKQVGDTVYVGDAVPPNVKHLCDADDVIDIIVDRAYDFAGEYADDCANVDDAAKAELSAMLSTWIEKHCELNFWIVKNEKPYVLTAEDFQA